MTDPNLTAVVAAFMAMMKESFRRARRPTTYVEIARVLRAKHYQQVGTACRGTGSTSYTLLVRWMDTLRAAGLGDATLTVDREGPRLTFVFPDGTLSEFPERAPAPGKRDKHGLTPGEREALVTAAVAHSALRTNMGRYSTTLDGGRNMFPLQNIPQGAGPVYSMEPATPLVNPDLDTLEDTLTRLVNVVLESATGAYVKRARIPASLVSQCFWGTGRYLWGAEVLWEDRADIMLEGSHGTHASLPWPP